MADMEDKVQTVVSLFLLKLSCLHSHSFGCFYSGCIDNSFTVPNAQVYNLSKHYYS